MSERMRKPVHKIDRRCRHRWALCNFGNLWSTHRTRTEAQAEAARATDEWRECFQIFKVTVIEGWQK